MCRVTNRDEKTKPYTYKSNHHRRVKVSNKFLMKNLITILCLCSFLFSQTNHNDSLIQVSSNDSQWYSYDGKLWIESKFTNFSDKDIIDFKYEISIYDKDNNLMNTFLTNHKAPFSFLEKTIKPNKTIKKNYTISTKLLKKYRFLRDLKIKIRVIQVTFSDETTIEYSTNLIDIKRDQSKLTLYFLRSMAFVILAMGLIGDDP